MRYLILLVALSWLGLQPAQAADSPAQMVVAEDSIEERLYLPWGLKPGRYEVQCEAEIGERGWVNSMHCYSFAGREAPYRLKRAVRRAVQFSRFVPAMRNDQPITVRAVLMVIVDTRLEEPLILAVLNNGVERARYGLLYTAPQRYGDLYVRTMGMAVEGPRPSVAWMQLLIDEQGAVKDCRLTNQGRVPALWTDAIRRAAANQFTFLPGYHLGKPVSMVYAEPMIWDY
jgi:hypothetical protein